MPRLLVTPDPDYSSSATVLLDERLELAHLDSQESAIDLLERIAHALEHASVLER